MLELNNISVDYGDQTVVDGVSVIAQTGSFIALVGPNGSGKSSLLKAVAGLVSHKGTTNLPTKLSLRAKSLAYLAQNATAPALRRVSDIVALGRTPHMGSLSRLSVTDADIVSNALDQCDISDFADRPFGTLSGGEQMRVHLARTLATQAPLLLADEPVTALDPYYQLSVMDVLKTYAANGQTVITALHDLDLACRYADRVWVMRDGKIVKNDKPAKALDAETLAQVFRITPDGFRI